MALVLHCSLRGRVGIKYTVDAASQSSSQPARRPDGHAVTAAGGEETITGNAASAIQRYGYALHAAPTQDSRFRYLYGKSRRNRVSRLSETDWAELGKTGGTEQYPHRHHHRRFPARGRCCTALEGARVILQAVHKPVGDPSRVI